MEQEKQERKDGGTVAVIIVAIASIVVVYLLQVPCSSQNLSRGGEFEFRILKSV